MRKPAKRKIASLTVMAGMIALAACGTRSGDPDATEENRQLDNAAHMLDVPDGDTANEAASLGNVEDAGNIADAGNSQ